MSATRCNKKSSLEIQKRRNEVTDFSKVGGLANHLKILRDTIIVPLLHNNVYSHFNIKTPRGVLFYGPPGTGKTLVAGALATELNRGGVGKVTFFKRKGADILDKWVGASESRLRLLFEQATKSRPAIIFFDELDGLAPIRSSHNDHVHCSLVTTLLALMDGLDSTPGVIIIGATNRVESVDPALRRPGRFDRELYFPLPSTEARKEILAVHVQSWRHKPNEKFLSELAEKTPGFCGSDLQALCAEALLCAMTRKYPNLQAKSKFKIVADELKIEEPDFLSARINITAASCNLENQIRKLDSVVAPLLKRQLDEILTQLKMLWPHFFTQSYKYSTENKRYAARLVLVGSNLQGVETHLVPAILQNFEHIPALCLDARVVSNRDLLINFCKNLPAILHLPHLDDLWNFADNLEQNYILSLLDNIHASLPILIIATHDEPLPTSFQNFFYNSTSLIIHVENPNQQEIADFFQPIFFGNSSLSLSSILNTKKQDSKQQSGEKKSKEYLVNSEKHHRILRLRQNGRTYKARSQKNFKLAPDNYRCLSVLNDGLGVQNLYTFSGGADVKRSLCTILTMLLRKSIKVFSKEPCEANDTSLEKMFGDSPGAFIDLDQQRIYSLWRRIVEVTSNNMSVSQLEVLYDTITACFTIHRHDFKQLITNLEEVLNEVEKSRSCVS